jgi:acyl-CoA thioester hydrolase
MGNSSIRWEVGLFTAAQEAPAAEGYFVHVYVDRTTRRPQPIPDAWRLRLAEFQVADDG